MDGVYLANVNPGLVTEEFFRSLTQLLIHDINAGKHLKMVVPRRSGALLSISRNHCVQHFLDESDAEWLWFVDSDIELYPTALDDLLAVAHPTERPVVSGVYGIVLNNQVHPSMYKLGSCTFQIRDNQTMERQSMIAMNLDNYEPGDILEVDGCGAGCLLIHRLLLESMFTVYGIPEPWFAQQIFEDVVYGEDFTFCMRTRQMGFPVTVATNVEVGHVKTSTIRPSLYRSQVDA